MKNNKVIITIFVILIILIFSIFLLNNYKNIKDENIDRKVEYIFDNLTYNNVFNKGSKLFLQGVKLLNINGFEYEKDDNGINKYYSINNYNSYKKITNFILVSNTLTYKDITKYMESKKIIKFENNYYIENYQEEKNNNYIGSIIDIDNYDDKYVYFKSVNYYCDNREYIGLLENEPDCNYTKNETKFTIVLENNYLRLYDFEEIKTIIK